MDKFIILQKVSKDKQCYKYDLQIMKESLFIVSLDFMSLIKCNYQYYSYEQFKQEWKHKGDNAGIDYDPWFMLDEPSGLIYAYSGLTWKDFEKAYLASLTPEEQEHYHKDSDDMPYDVDFFREGKAPYYCTMHKENLFELFASWDACAQKEYDYIVWYEDETGWVRLQGFSTLEQAQEFVANK